MLDTKDCKLYVTLILWALVPAVYLLIRMNLVTVNHVDINILGQMEWFDLLNEVITTTLIVPLYSLLKPDRSSASKNGLCFLLSFGLYFLFTVTVCVNITRISAFMYADHAAAYLALQSISLLVGFIGTFMIMLFSLHNDYKTVAILILSRLFLLSVFDCVLISQKGDIGSVISEITVNFLLSALSLGLALYKKYIQFRATNLSWIKDWIRIGSFAGIQIFLDNFIYAMMVCRMVNVIQESGNYWIANNFIWGWLLIPVTSLTTVIQKNDLKKLTFKNTWRYAIGIILFWAISMPFWKWFIEIPMASNAESILKIVFPLIPFYIVYVICAFIDAWFISHGKTFYNTITSAIVNILYYGIIYILFRRNVFPLNLMFIVYMFGVGMVVHTIFSLLFYYREMKKASNC